MRAAGSFLAGSAGTSAECASVTVPVDYQPGRSELQLVGHQSESVTPYSGTTEMQRRMGGSLLTVKDDRHGSLVKLPYASEVVRFSEAGQPGPAAAPVPEPRP
ncbi:alpha/beta hydrolase [Amycolatopsis sulphurea]|uniref:alpha/beta hydrolase n=1 Tax=Amycolatopsis sulphurea TaxID=76022 RepID=UPI0014763291|nr:alpha/beta hydrolase [Amycolatopsis sulphurea]